MSEAFAHDGEHEHGWEALRGLAGRISPRLALLQRQREYSPVSPWVAVPVDPCPFCADGGLRMAGYVTRRRRLLSVRQCDTCGAVGVGSSFYPGDLDPDEYDEHD